MVEQVKVDMKVVDLVNIMNSVVAVMKMPNTGLNEMKYLMDLHDRLQAQLPKEDTGGKTPKNPEAPEAKAGLVVGQD